MKKYCIKCGESKNLEYFGKDKSRNDGLRLGCKECSNRIMRAYRKTKKGLVSAIYGHQRYTSKQRGHAMPAYSSKDLKDWLLAQKKFHHLFHLWEVSGYDKLLIPSVDRLDDYLPYSFSNIQLMTWQENNLKGNRTMKEGKNNKQSKGVMQFTLDGELIADYYSSCDAGRRTGIKQSGISRCCTGEYKKAGGFRWEYV